MLVNQNDLTYVLDRLRGITTLAIDTETTGLERTDKPFAVIIATAETEYYFDERCTGDFWHSLNGLGTHQWALQNPKFDLKMLSRKGVTLLGRTYDIACGGRLLRNDHLKYSLDAQAERILGVRKSDAVKEYIKEHNLYGLRFNYFGEEYKSPMYDRVPLNIMAEYACLDARITYDLHKRYTNLLDSESLDLYQMEAALVPVCLKMEETGLRLDANYTLSAMYHETKELEETKEKFKDLTGQGYVNSAKSLQKVLATKLPLTEKGNPTCTDEVLEDIIRDAPDDRDSVVARLVQQMRGLDKRINTYFKSYLTLATRERTIHPSMWQPGTRTGRFSYSDPNLQNIPKEETPEYKHIVRRCFIPRPGRKYVSFDYSQMEYRMAAAYAGATDLITAVMEGADFHQATADLVGIPRSSAKTLNFATLYGAGADKIASMLGISKQKAEQLKFSYFSKMPKIEQLIDNVIRTGRARGYVTTWCGRRMYADKEFCYALPNHLIQGGGADVVKKAMLQIAAEFPHLMMVLQVHDQLVFELADEQMQHIPRIKEIMEGVFPPMNGMVLKVDVSISKHSLAETEMEKYDPDRHITI